MKAIVTRAFGKPPTTVIEERQKPAAKDGYSIVRIQAATINQLSRYIREGDVPGSATPLVLGNEGAGVIEQSARFKPGTRVGIYGGNRLGIKEDGLFQEWVSVEDKRLFEVPQNLDWEVAATLSVNFLTAWRALTHSVKVQPGQSILVSGATGSVGNAVVQVANALGLRSIALVTSAAKVAGVKQAGADEVIEISAEADIGSAVRALTDGKGADFAFDPVGGDVLAKLVEAVAFRGTVVSLGFAGGMSPWFPAYDLIAGEKKIIGYALHAERDEDVIEPLEQLVKLAAEGKVRPQIDSRYTPETYDEGYQRLVSRKAVGSIILTL